MYEDDMKHIFWLKSTKPNELYVKRCMRPRHA